MGGEGDVGNTGQGKEELPTGPRANNASLPSNESSYNSGSNSSSKNGSNVSIASNTEDFTFGFDDDIVKSLEDFSVEQLNEILKAVIADILKDELKEPKIEESALTFFKKAMESRTNENVKQVHQDLCNLLWVHQVRTLRSVLENKETDVFPNPPA